MILLKFDEIQVQYVYIHHKFVTHIYLLYRSKSNPDELNINDFKSIEPGLTDEDKTVNLKSRILEDSDSSREILPTTLYKSKTLTETKSEYVQRQKQKPKKKRTSVAGNMLCKHQHPHHVFNKKNLNFTEHHGHSSGDSDHHHHPHSQMRCFEHNKELDMVCEEPGCMTAVCSSCILFGSHKNHQYSQVETFYANLENVKSNLKGVQTDVARIKQGLVESHDEKKYLPRIRKTRKKIEQGLAGFCEQLINRILRKKEQVMDELAAHFGAVHSKLRNYCEESLGLVNKNDQWNESLSLLFLELENNPRSVANSFNFLNRVKSQQYFMKGQRMMDNFGEIQNLLNLKIQESLESFSIKFNEIGENLFESKRREISFKNDIRRKLEIFNEGLATGDAKNPQNVNIHEMELKSGPLDEDCFLEENMNVLGTNLMSSLNLLNDKVKNNQFDFSNQQQMVEKSFTHGVDGRRPLKDKVLNMSHLRSQNELSEMIANQRFKESTILSSSNTEIEFGQRAFKPSKSKKKFKVKDRSKLSQGKLGYM